MERKAHLREVGQAQVRVLKQHPLALGTCRDHVAARDDLLALAHAHAQRLDFLALCQVLYQLQRVSAWTPAGPPIYQIALVPAACEALSTSFARK